MAYIFFNNNYNENNYIVGKQVNNNRKKSKKGLFSKHKENFHYNELIHNTFLKNFNNRYKSSYREKNQIIYYIFI